MSVDLTPFGYTPTETLVYQALLDLGPSSGYAVAKHVSVARANAYQALNGLVAKGAAALVDERPQRFRAVQPRALLARIANDEAGKLDRLEEQIESQSAGGAESLVGLSGLRAIQEVATRSLVRAVGDVYCIAPPDFLKALVPALRKREADGRAARVWTVGAGEPMAVEIVGAVDEARVMRAFGAPATFVSASDGAIAAGMGDEPRGYWTSDPIIRGLIESTVLSLTA